MTMTWIALFLLACFGFVIYYGNKQDRRWEHRRARLRTAVIDEAAAERARRRQQGTLGGRSRVVNFDVAIFEPEDGSGSIGVILEDDQGEPIPWQYWDEVTQGQLFSVKAVGGQRFHPEELQMREFEPGQPVMLVREPDNPVDPNAVAVYDADGRNQVGYVPAEDAARVKDAIAADAKAWVAWQTLAGDKRVGLRLAVVTGPLKRQFESVMETVASRIR